MRKTLNITPEEMSSRIFRFGDRRPHMNHAPDASIPGEVFEALNPPIYLLLAHAAADCHEKSRPAIADAKGLAVGILEIPPGQKVALHVHFRSREAFLCLRGRVKFCWNDGGAEETVLEPFDMISVPLRVYRGFQCVGDEPALLLAIVTDEDEGTLGDIFVGHDDRERFAERFGRGVLEKLTAATGFHFTDPASEEIVG